MKIKKKTDPNTVHFKHIQRGDVFSYSGGVYQRTENLFSSGRCALNAICLSNGLALHLTDDTSVVPHPEAELTIKE